MGGAIGSIVGPIVTGPMAADLTWRPTIMIMTIPGFVLSAILWLSVSAQLASSVPNQGGNSSSVANLRELIKYSPVVLFIIAAFFYALGQRGMDAFGNVYFNKGRGFELAAASILFSSLKWAGPFSAPICGKLSDIYGRKKVLIALVLLESVSLYAITAVSNALVAIPCIIFGFGAFGLLAVGEALLADIAPEKQRATIFGLHLTVNFSSYIFLVPILFALPSFYGYNLGLVVLSILMLVSIPLILKIRTKPHLSSGEKAR
jgi:MFS family permease